jgi:regulator of protease activity HflC (stomatin/prohibitin superfamily)
MYLQRIRIREFELGLKFRDDVFVGLVEPGVGWIFDPRARTRIEISNLRSTQFVHPQLDEIVKSGALKGLATVIDLKDRQRALVWIDGRFHAALTPGLYAYWTGRHEVRVEAFDASVARLEHPELKAIVRSPSARVALDVCTVERDRAGALFLDGRYDRTLPPGQYAFWKGAEDARVVEVDLRETTVEILGQEIMTADKVTLRLNALATYRVVDPRKAVSESDDVRQAIYREAQLALRAAVGARELDAVLADKESVSVEAFAALQERAARLGLAVTTIGVRDLILPGDMKDLMNKVMEARKAAEANLIARREETAAIRSQANTAKLLADNPGLMRIRELEVLERIATSGQLRIVAGEKGLADRIVNLI